MNILLKKAYDINDEVTANRRHIHENPEWNMDTENTAAFVERVLAEIGITNVRRSAKTGVLALIEGSKPGKCVGLRADMDALRITETNDLPFRSKNTGLMHACGHDVHTSCLLGAAKILHEMRDSISGSVKLFFQPGEETIEGALEMIKDKALENPKVDAMYMFHCWPFFPAKTIGLKKGPALAAVLPLRITIKGKQAHGQFPDRSIDPILIAGHIICALQSVVSREISPLVPAAFGFGTIHGGSTTNVIPDEVCLEGGIRAVTTETGEEMLKAVTRIVENTAAAFRGTATVEVPQPLPGVFNTDEIYERMHSTYGDIIGKDAILEIPHTTMGGDDFAFYLEHVPGGHCRLGTSNPNIPSGPLHSPDFMVDEDCLPYGVAAMVGIALEELGCRK